ncbi:hypothetical protein B0H10DRAFT_2012989 [Mycena sp. CBHHK59/15]|nr:hypothetical protein B0H10DRAFT_2012989 [Mycena sp. CBHHK59/15]
MHARCVMPLVGYILGVISEAGDGLDVTVWSRIHWTPTLTRKVSVRPPWKQKKKLARGHRLPSIFSFRKDGFPGPSHWVRISSFSPNALARNLSKQLSILLLPQLPLFWRCSASLHLLRNTASIFVMDALGFPAFCKDEFPSMDYNQQCS